jgi:uncharacterized protein (TIGR02757 family)
MQRKLTRSFLEKLYDEHHKIANLNPDPLIYARGYSATEEGEVAALVSASFAYGQVEKIVSALGQIFKELGERPAEMIVNTDPMEWLERFQGFTYRFHKTPDIALYLWLLRQALERRGSLRALFAAHDKRGDDGGIGIDSTADIAPAISGFCAEILAGDPRPLLPTKELPRRHPVRHLLASPSGGSASKRLCLFLRWMGRSDELDPGYWSDILSPARLVVPLDTHVARVGKLLGMTTRKSADWKTAVEITQALAKHCPTDPLRYDFSLFRYGMEEISPVKRKL